jgi:hypothetical protein
VDQWITDNSKTEKQLHGEVRELKCEGKKAGQREKKKEDAVFLKGKIVRRTY